MTSQTGQRGWGDDDGFTLVELLLVIFILGIITVPLGDVVLGFLRNTDATTSRLLESHDAQIASAYWAHDVASIGTRNALGVLEPSIELPTMTPDTNCKFVGTIARLTWDDFANSTSPATVVTVAYVVTFDPLSAQCELHRVRSTSPATDVVLAHHLDPSTPPTVTCSTDCTGAPALPPVPPVPNTVTLTLALKDPGNRDDAYVVPLTGQRRQS